MSRSRWNPASSLLWPLAAIALVVCASTSANAQDFEFPRCEIVPIADHQVSMRIDGVEKLRWNFGSQYPRPFFYPFNGPSGSTLTRMGHPGAQNHDHHRSIWFAHHKVQGLNFWADNTGTRIRQAHWYRYRDGDEEAVLAVNLSWTDPDGVEIMQQDVVASLMPIKSDAEQEEHALELQLTFRPGTGKSETTLEQTNFGFLAVRVCASISGYFGGGRLTNHDGVATEANLHEKSAAWMDYSGPVSVPTATGRKAVEEGITYFDHPDNPGYPNHWHVRQDGWMGAAPCMKSEIKITHEKPLTLRYLLHAHHGALDQTHAQHVHDEFKSRGGFLIRKPKSNEPHRQYEVERLPRMNPR